MTNIDWNYERGMFLSVPINFTEKGIANLKVLIIVPMILISSPWYNYNSLIIMNNIAMVLGKMSL